MNNFDPKKNPPKQVFRWVSAVAVFQPSRRDAGNRITSRMLVEFISSIIGSKGGPEAMEAYLNNRLMSLMNVRRDPAEA